MPSATNVPDPIFSDSDTSDSDFAASRSASDTEGSSSSNEDGKPTKGRKRTRDEEAFGSGDEGIVESGRRKKRRKHKKKGKRKDENARGDYDDESEEGVGARLKRRREGRGETDPKRKGRSSSEAATTDIDALWARLNSAPSIRPQPDPPPDLTTSKNGDTDHKQNGHFPDNRHVSDGTTTPPSDMITIKRTYNFAGTTTTEEKLVPRDSAEARVYLSTLAPPKSPSPSANPSLLGLRRPLKRPSRFDVHIQNATDLSKATAAIQAPLKSLAELKAERGQKLNTVEKSRLDWAGYVDKEKLKDELDKAEKAKGGYLDKMDFLGRTEMAREEGLREGRR